MMKVNGRVLSYEEYIDYVTELVRKGQTSGLNQSNSLIEFTALNLKRMERIYKTFAPLTIWDNTQISVIPDQYWYVITEAWCGDSAQTLPVIARIAGMMGGKIQLRIIFRDENPEWMDKYHTNGSRSIPKLVAFDKEGLELFTWGPRPEAAQALLLDWKNNPQGKSWDDFEKDLHTWYAKDKTISTQTELIKLVAEHEKTSEHTGINAVSNIG